MSVYIDPMPEMSKKQFIDKFLVDVNFDEWFDLSYKEWAPVCVIQKPLFILIQIPCNLFEKMAVFAEPEKRLCKCLITAIKAYGGVPDLDRFFEKETSDESL